VSLQKPGMESDADAKKTSGNREKILVTSLPLFTEWDSTIMFIPLFIKFLTQKNPALYMFNTM
jgi:hypothetical protein